MTILNSLVIIIILMNNELVNKPPAYWTIKYWQWIYSKPRDENPLITGNINNEDFICLPCTGGGEDCGRKITLSGEDAEKDILVPVFASEYCNAEVMNGTDNDLRAKAREMSAPIAMKVSLDSESLTPYYVESEPFNLKVPVESFVGK